MPPEARTLTPQERERARRTLLWDGLFARLLDTLTGGVFLAVLAIYLGANNFTIGLLASLPFFAQVAQVPVVRLLLRVRDRKTLVVRITTAGRLLVIAFGVLIFLYGADLGPRVLVAFMATLAVLAVIATAAWNWWVRDTIPRDELGRYFSRRMRLTTMGAAAVLLLAGAYLDRATAVGRTQEGLALLFVVGGVCGLVSTLFLMLTPHRPPAAMASADRAYAIMAETLRDRRNLRLVLGLGLVASTMSIALPFTAVYMLRSLGYSSFLVTVLALLSQLAYVGGLRGWGFLSDRFGNPPVLKVSVGMLVASMLGWSFAWSEHGLGLLVFVALLHFLTGFANGGIELTYANVLLKAAPEENAPAYLAAMGLVRAAIAGVATLLAGAAWQFVGRGEIFAVPIQAVDWSLRGFHVLALASVASGIAALFLLRGTYEEGGGPVVEVAVAMRREVRNMSSVAGIRGFVHVVSYVVEFLATEPVRTKRRRKGPEPDSDPAATVPPGGSGPRGGPSS